jgi:methionyl-tRNA synthetase
MTYIKDPNSAIQLFPMISDYMEANIRNDEVLVKLAAVVQRVIQMESKSSDGEFGLSEVEKEQIIGKLEEATKDLQKEVDDINLSIT